MFTSVMAAPSTLVKLEQILTHELKLDIHTTRELMTAGLCTIIYKIPNFGEKFGEKHVPIPLYKRPWIVL
jgi:hypothetical protein